MSIPFTKYQGTGNDFIVIDDRSDVYRSSLSASQIASLCDRRFGVGADGMILLANSATHDFRMIYFNADGAEATFCGNGARCIVAFAHRVGILGPEYRFDAADGEHIASYRAQRVRLRMGRPTGFEALSDTDFWIDTGSPHYVRFVDQHLDQMEIEALGRPIRCSERFAAIGGTNVNFVQATKTGLQVRTFERGVERETLSCGTGVVACAYVRLMQLQETTGKISIQTRGGELSVEVDQLQASEEEVWLSGPASFVFEGTLP